jgi:hypothetical protein
MVKILQDIWILLKNGVVIYQRTFNNDLDPQLFGGFMSALNSFATQLNRDGLSSFEMGNKKFYFLKRELLTFISNAAKEVKPKKVMDELINIADKFEQHYPREIIEHWDGNLNFFESFEKVINDSLEDLIDRFKKAFW